MFVIPSDDPVLSWRMDGDLAVIYRLEIAERLRGQGFGTRLYQAWEANLPKTVTKVEVWAMNKDSARFWERVGFVDKHHLQNEDGSMTMIKTLDRRLANQADQQVAPRDEGPEAKEALSPRL